MNATYRIIDENGRMYIPKAVRESAGVGSGAVLELRAGKGRITLTKADIRPPAPPTVDDILEMLEAVPKASLFEATAKLTAILAGGRPDSG